MVESLVFDAARLHSWGQEHACPFVPESYGLIERVVAVKMDDAWKVVRQVREE
ncbi:MAG: hypothetical protein ABIH41_03025 [Nanoarchaeota archaeon]